MKNFWEALNKLKEIRKKKFGGDPASRLRVDDLFIKIYSYSKDIHLPIPNLYAEAMMKRHFGGLDKIDFANDEHIAALLVILDNQDDEKMEYWADMDWQANIRVQMQRIPVYRREHYQQAMFEMFQALKKNSIHREREFLQQILTIVSHGKS